MSNVEYNPDNWVVIGIKPPNEESIVYKILAGWSGSYLHGSSWKLNSGITNVEEDGDYYLFHGYSGSVYRCHKETYGIRLNTAPIWNMLSAKYPNSVKLLENDEWKHFLEKVE